MQSRPANSLIMVWGLAEMEARRLNAHEIEPAHLLLGLCKIVDLDIGASVPDTVPNRKNTLEKLLREVRQLRDVFQAAEWDPKVFRRRLRQSLGAGRFVAKASERLHRSQAAKAVFSEAEQYAGIAGGTMLPVHLLYAVLVSKEKSQEALLSELAIDKQRLHQLAKYAALSTGVRGPGCSDDRKWNLN